MSTERIEEKLKVLIVDQLFLKIKPVEIEDNDDLEKKWKLSSIEIMQLVVGLEEVFGIELGDNEFSKEKFRTVKKIAEVVRAKKPDA